MPDFHNLAVILPEANRSAFVRYVVMTDARGNRRVFFAFDDRRLEARRCETDVAAVERQCLLDDARRRAKPLRA